MPTLLERLSNAANALLGREQRSIAAFDMSLARSTGMPALFKAKESLEAFGDSAWLYKSVMSIAMKIATIDFKLRVENAEGEFDHVKKHQALETLRLPQP